MNRLDDNLAILARLERYLRDNPDQRFGQALRNLRVVEQIEAADGRIAWRDGFNEEPDVTLRRIDGNDTR